MKYKLRVFVLATTFTLCFSFLLWPNSSYQNLLFFEMVPRMTRVLSHNLAVPAKCQKYFEVLRAQAGKPSTSRYLLSRHIANHVSHLRIYLHCFVALNVPETPHTHAAGNELLPMFLGRLPATTRDHDWLAFAAGDSCYWLRYLAASAGRGIVVSIDNTHVDYAARLLNVLHRLGSTLPVQFVHEGDLLLQLVAVLQRVAADKQVVEFIDVRPTLNRGYRDIFQGYNNKWFAALFTTFEEMILMDADAVPFVDPAQFFDLDGYQKAGAFFFRDRELPEMLSQTERDYLSSMIPVGDVFFNVAADKGKFDNNFFNYRSKHVAESGVVVMDRRQHTRGLLMSLALQYWYQSGRIMYGDKDLFWLGLLISGDSNYYFNLHAAGAVGVVENGNTVCLSQLAHLSDDKKLLWTNGALFNCKKNSWLSDYVKYATLREKFDYSIFALRQSYSQAIDIEAVVLPPSIARLNGAKTSALRGGFNKRYDRGCGGTYYCATSDDGGEVVYFSEEEKRHYADIVRVWSADY